MRIEMPEKRKKYDREFREGAVRIVEETNKPIAQVARDLGVNEGTLGNWFQRARAAREGHGELSMDGVEELKRLRAEVAELRMEREAIRGPVGEGGDEVSVARFIADQRTNYRVPHTITCLLLGVSLAWFYKWWARANGPSATSGLHTSRDRRRDTLDRAVRVMFTAKRGLHGSPRLYADLVDAGWRVSENTVADSMRRQGLVARRMKRRNGLTTQDKTAPKFGDLLKRNFTADRPNAKWVGDMVRHEALFDRVGVRDHHRRAVAAVR